MKSHQSGFTLLELLTTLSIIAILSAIAIPQYREYKARGYDTAAKVDLRNVALAEEAYFYDFERYLSCQNAGCEELPGVAALSRGTELTITTIDDNEFNGVSSNENGTGRQFSWSSENGGMQR